MTDLGKFTTPIRRNVEPYLVPAPVEEYFEHWGHAWATTPRKTKTSSTGVMITPGTD